MLYNIIVLEPFMSFHYNTVTVTMSCVMYDPSCDFDVILDLNPRFPRIENKGKGK